MKYAWFEYDSYQDPTGQWAIVGLAGYVKDITKWSSSEGLSVALFGPHGPTVKTTKLNGQVVYVTDTITGKPLGKLVRIPKPVRKENGW